jgi:hypothetical protein
MGKEGLIIWFRFDSRIEGIYECLLIILFMHYVYVFSEISFAKSDVNWRF